MLVIEANNVNDAYHMGLLHMSHLGVMKTSRNGAVMSFPYPVMTAYQRPHERVLFDAERDANPFFHLFESLWMLGGQREFEFLKQYNSTIGQFSDDNRTLHGAYGYRWRYHFGKDQLDAVIGELGTNPSSRRVVLSMWDPYIDPAVADVGGKDVPCNTHIYFNVRANGELDMTVCCRSNDMIWGAYGANAVHMSILHEYVALAIGRRMGTYYQMSNDLHVYERHFDLVRKARGLYPEFYETEFEPGVTHEPLWDPHPMAGRESKLLFDQDVKKFLSDPTQLPNNYRTAFFAGTIYPMANAWKLHKAKMHTSALDMAEQIEATDWRKACKEWIARRAPLVVAK